jgi:hypothetical protein
MSQRVEITYRGTTKSLFRWAACAGIDYQTLRGRLRKGWSFERALETPPCPKNAASLRHGMTGSKEYRAWLGMKRRCSDVTLHNAHRYVGRGIVVCEEWQSDFEAFFRHVGPAPSPSHSLGRINNDRGYEPGNVRWETPSEQARNRG